jgi:hypothetical protein
MLVLGACASPFTKAETPEQALAAAAQRSRQLHSDKFDLSGQVALTFPPELAKSLQQSGLASGNFSIDLSGTGEAQFPDRYRASVDAKVGGMSVSSKVVVVAGKTYIQNPLTQKWEVSASSGLSSGFNQPDPLSYTELLNSAQSVKDLGDTKLGGVDVHHYQVIPDKAKLAARLDTSASVKSAQAKAALKQMLDSGALKVEVWFGKDDHLVRRLSTDADYTLDLAQLFANLSGASGGAGAMPSMPPGSSLRAVAHLVINYHDFDAPVTVTAPSVG